MKRLLLVPVLALALSAGGCAGFQQFWQTASTAASIATASIANPVTQQKEDQIEASVQLVFTGLKTYKSACVQGIADTNCKSTIASIQVYTRQVPPLLTQLRGFVKNNDQINATVIYNQVSALLDNVKPLAAQAQIKTGG